MTASLIAALCCLQPARSNAEDSIAAEPPVTESDRAHWAYEPLLRPDVPEMASAWPRNAVDRFILQGLRDADLDPMPETDRVTLIRRVTFDLTGLPPQPEDIQAFLEDDFPDAYERLVDRLLASPEYGVRWGQHWLDLARFAETDGFEHDKIRPAAWRYRDWVIRSLNADMPYDEFVRQQIAGDLLHPHEPSAVIATGFLLCGPDMPDINLLAERRHNVLNEMTSTVGSVFLGMNVGCAQCHDHKFDPLSQRDFYRLRAFFENMEIFKDHPLPDRRYRDQRLAELDQDIDELEQRALERSLKEDAKVGIEYQELLKKFLTKPEQDRHRRLTAEWNTLRKTTPQEPAMGRVVKEKSGAENAAYLWIRGDFRRRGPELQPAYLRIANPDDLDPDESQPARAELANWITRKDHPLTARVMVNRLWQHHFGQGLSASPSNFGIMGQEPTHPELLDWLAVELASDWGLKRMHRLLVTSATYRLASKPVNPAWPKETHELAKNRWKAALAADPENQRLARMRRRRMEGEAIRDALLAATGELSQRRGGPGVRPPLPPELLSTLLKNQWPVTKDEKDHNRRSLYLFVRRNLRFPIFDVFDQPDTNASCAMRARSTIAPQALTMMNAERSHHAAEVLADQTLESGAGSPAQRVQRVFLKTLARQPTKWELEHALNFLKSQSETGSEISEREAWRDFCLALLNTNEFLYID